MSSCRTRDIPVKGGVSTEIVIGDGGTEFLSDGGSGCVGDGGTTC